MASSRFVKGRALALIVAAAALLLVARPARADDVSAPSEEDVWQRKVHRHRVNGALGFAGTYGGAAAAGGVFTGLVLEHDRKNPGSDSSGYLAAVAVPLFTPVVGPIILGGLVAVGYTGILFTSGRGSGENGGRAYVVLNVAFAPVAYGFSALAIADGIMQGVFLKQALGWSDPPRPSSAALTKPTMGQRLLTVSPMVIPEAQAPTWIAVSARGLPSAVGLQLPLTW